MTAGTFRLTLVVGLWLLITALLACCQIWLQLSFARLRDRHRDIWEKLGQPHVLSGNGAYYPARKFLWSKECRVLGDELLAQRARRAYCFGMTAAVLGLLLVGSLVVGAILTAT